MPPRMCTLEGDTPLLPHKSSGDLVKLENRPP